MLRAHRSRQIEERLRAGLAWQGEKWGDLVFPNEIGEPLPGTQLTRRFQAVLAAVGLPRQRFHDLRHAAATFMLSEGVSLRTTMELLGHSTIAVTANTYSHVLPELQRDATERVSALLALQ
jgi:integrase